MERVLQSAAQVEGGELSLTRVIKLLEALEMGKTSQRLVDSSGSSLNRISQYKKNKDSNRQHQRDNREKTSNNKNDKPASCSNCGSQQHTSKLSDRREHCKAFQETYAGCGIMGHFKNLCRSTNKSSTGKTRDKKPTGKDNPKLAAVSEEPAESADSASLGQISANWFLINGGRAGVGSPMPTGFEPPFKSHQKGQVYNNINRAGVGSPMPTGFEPPFKSHQKGKGGNNINLISNTASKIPHMACDKSGSWQKQNVEPHARIEVQLSTCLPAYKQLHLQKPTCTVTTRVVALADTGAQMCVADLSTVDRMGIQRHLLPQPFLNVSGANNEDLKILWVAFLTITSPTGSHTNQMVYLADNVGEFYLSKAACRQLGIIDANFPTPHSPTSSLELGNLGESSPYSGGLQLVSNSSNTNYNSPHVLNPAIISYYSPASTVRRIPGFSK